MFKTVSNEVKKHRLGICRSCEDFSVNICMQCGCYMPAKTLFADVECPKQKWTKNTPGTTLINTLEEAILQSWNKL